MCSGRVDLSFVLRAFSRGIDGVFIGGCHLNECHYLTDGNYHALSMVLLCKKLMKQIGLSPERLRIEGVSAGEGIRFAEIMNDFSMKLKELGPLGKGEKLGEEGLKLKLQALSKLVPYLRLVEGERLRVHLRSEEAYHRFYESAEFDRLFKELVEDQLAMGQIVLLLGARPLSTGELSGILDLSPSEVSRHISNSSRRGLIRYDVDRKGYTLA